MCKQDYLLALAPGKRTEDWEEEEGEGMCCISSTAVRRLQYKDRRQEEL